MMARKSYKKWDKQLDKHGNKRFVTVNARIMDMGVLAKTLGVDRNGPIQSHYTDLIMRNLRAQGLETPLLQKRLVEAWPMVAGEVIARYTTNVVIRNQTLFVSLNAPALRADLSMRRQEFVQKLNNYVGNQVIADIRFC
jgi:hypothetical protein